MDKECPQGTNKKPRSNNLECQKSSHKAAQINAEFHFRSVLATVNLLYDL